MKVGFIGLGLMGHPMAMHLLKAGHTLGVYARRVESASALVSAGATWYASPAALAADCEMVFTMVTSSSDVEQIVLGEQGIAKGLKAGGVLVDMETIAPSVVRRMGSILQTQGIDMLDAPVSGGPIGAEQASLVIMAGGKPAVFERVKPLFACMGKRIIRVGDLGAGQTTKACNQLLLLVTAQGVAEALSCQACGSRSCHSA